MNLWQINQRVALAKEIRAKHVRAAGIKISRAFRYIFRGDWV